MQLQIQPGLWWPERWWQYTSELIWLGYLLFIRPQFISCANKVLLEHSPGHTFWIICRYIPTTAELCGCDRDCMGLQSQKYLPSGPSQENFAGPVLCFMFRFSTVVLAAFSYFPLGLSTLRQTQRWLCCISNFLACSPGLLYSPVRAYMFIKFFLLHLDWFAHLMPEKMSLL